MGITDSRGEPLLTPTEVSKFLGISRAAAYRLIENKVLKKVKKRGVRQTYIALANVERYKTGLGMTHKELVERVLLLEQLVHRQAMTQVSAPRVEQSRAQMDHDPLAVEEALRLHHPELFN